MVQVKSQRSGSEMGALEGHLSQMGLLNGDDVGRGKPREHLSLGSGPLADVPRGNAKARGGSLAFDWGRQEGS